MLGLFRAMRRLPLLERRLLYRRLIKEQAYADLVPALKLGNEANARTRFRRAKVQLLLQARKLRLEPTSWAFLEAGRDTDGGGDGR